MAGLVEVRLGHRNRLLVYAAHFPISWENVGLSEVKFPFLESRTKRKSMPPLSPSGQEVGVHQAKGPFVA